VKAARIRRGADRVAEWQRPGVWRDQAVIACRPCKSSSCVAPVVTSALRTARRTGGARRVSKCSWMRSGSRSRSSATVQDGPGDGDGRAQALIGAPMRASEDSEAR